MKHLVRALRPVLALALVLAFVGCSDVLIPNDPGSVTTATGTALRSSASPAPASPVFSITDLGTFGAERAQARDVNARGEVVGWIGGGAGPDLHEEAFLWIPGEGGHALGTLGGNVSEAWAVNDRGDVVGRGNMAPFTQSHAFLWTRRDGIAAIGAPAFSVAWDVNDRGQVVGRMTVGGQARPFLWSEREGLVDLGAPGGQGAARAINQRGDVAGESLVTPGSPVNEAFLWTRREGLVALGFPGLAQDVNDRGHVAGWRQDPDHPSVTMAVFWTPDEGAVDIGPPDAASSEAWAINDEDQVVGTWIDPALHLPRAFYWSRRTGLVTLPNLVAGGSSRAFGINERGEIVGGSNLVPGGGRPTAVLWSMRR